MAENEKIAMSDSQKVGSVLEKAVLENVKTTKLSNLPFLKTLKKLYSRKCISRRRVVMRATDSDRVVTWLPPLSSWLRRENEEETCY
jgi:hypothetical protein